MSESLRNDGRIWVPTSGDEGQKDPREISEDERDYYLERRYPAFGNLVPRDVASRAAKVECDAGKGVGPTKLAVYLDFEDAINRVGENTIREKYGNLFDMYERITDENHDAAKQTVAETTERIDKLLALKGEKTVDEIHRELGLLLWNNCGMARNKEGLLEAREKLPSIREDFWANANVLGARDDLNQSLEYAGRVGDFLELAPFLVEDALSREESCGCHLREEHQTPESEALRNDEDFTYVAAWEFKGVGEPPELHKEELTFETVKPSTRSYK
jgi:succinate dehydrogenase/fumarate reductase flavoprotein subunit